MKKMAHYINIKSHFTGMSDARHIQQLPQSICVETLINALIMSRNNPFTKKLDIPTRKKVEFFFRGICGIAWGIMIPCFFVRPTLQQLVDVLMVVGICACVVSIIAMIVDRIVAQRSQFELGYDDYVNGYNEVISFARIADWDSNWYKVGKINSKMVLYCEDLHLLGMYDAMRLIPMRSPERLIAYLDLLAYNNDRTTKRHLRIAKCANYEYIIHGCENTCTLATYYFKVLEDQHNASARN